MTATAINTNGWAMVPGSSSPIPPTVRLQLSTLAPGQVGRGQNCSVDVNGNAILNDGTVPNLMPAGFAYPEYISDQATATGAAATDFWQGWGSGNPASTTTANDGFLASDWGTPFFFANENTPGKLSNFGGNNRSIGGLVFGLDNFGNPRQWSGAIAGLIARSTLITNTKDRSWWNLADATAAATAAETAMNQEKLHGLVTGIEFIPSTNTNADPANYGTITISKRNGAGGAATVIGTLSTQSTANGTAAQFTTMQFTLSTAAGALNILETDVLTIQETKNGTGAVLNGTVRVLEKVI